MPILLESRTGSQPAKDSAPTLTGGMPTWTHRPTTGYRRRFTASWGAGAQQLSPISYDAEPKDQPKHCSS